MSTPGAAIVHGNMVIVTGYPVIVVVMIVVMAATKEIGDPWIVLK